MWLTFRPPVKIETFELGILGYDFRHFIDAFDADFSISVHDSATSNSLELIKSEFDVDHSSAVLT